VVWTGAREARVSGARVESVFHCARGIEMSLQPFEELLAAGREGYHLWELFRVDEPVALLHYVDVRRIGAGRIYRHWNGRDEVDQRAALVRWCEQHMSRQGLAPASVAEEARSIVERVVAELSERWPEVIAARAAAAALADPLVRWELEQLRSGEHRNDRLRAREPTAQRVSAYERVRPTRAFPEAIYALLDEVVAHPGLKGLTHRGTGDWALLKRGCLEQLRRLGGVPESARNAFPISVLAPWTSTRHNDPFIEPEDWIPALNPYPGWARGINFQFEGYLLHDVYVEDQSCGGACHGWVDSGMNLRGDELTGETILPLAPLVVVGYDDPLRASFRHWLRHPCGWLAGVLAHAKVAAELLLILERHGFVLEAEASE
jgi:hypothetical protein